MILNQCGCFSVKKGSRDVIESLNYCLELLMDNKNMVLIFPQGEIQSLYTQSFLFENGLDFILRNIRKDIEIVFNVNLIDYFSQQKPSLNIYFEEFFLNQGDTKKELENAFNSFAIQCKMKQTKDSF